MAVAEKNNVFYLLRGLNEGGGGIILLFNARDHGRFIEFSIGFSIPYINKPLRCYEQGLAILEYLSVVG